MKRFAGLLLIALASISSRAQTPDCTALAQQALEMSGMNREIDAVAQLFSSDDFISQMTADKPNGPDFAAVIKPIMTKTFNGPTLKKDLLRRVVARCRVDQMNQAVQEMQTALIARMLQLEAARYTPEGQEKIKKYMKIIQIAPPPDSQLEQADAFDRKVGVTEQTVDYLFAMTRGILGGAGAPPDLLSRLQERRKQLTAQLSGTTLASILLTYSGVSKPDLERYADKLSSGPMKWYYDTVHKSFLEVVEQRAEEIGHDIKSAVTVNRAASL